LSDRIYNSSSHSRLAVRFPQLQINARYVGAAHERILLKVRMQEHIPLQVGDVDIVAHESRQASLSYLIQLPVRELGQLVVAVLVVVSIAELQVPELLGNYT
jgi:hypothetical protein